MQVRTAQTNDVSACVAIIQKYREALARYEPRFWKPATTAAAMSAMFFEHSLATAPVAIVAEDGGHVIGFLIATQATVPPVYDAPGKTALIDDFAIDDRARWDEIGSALLREARHRLAADGYGQIVVVNAAKDSDKAAFLATADLSLTTQWWTAAV